MGEVYLAEDVRLRRKVALKVLPPQYAADPGRRRRFVREGTTASRLSHPNVAVVYEADETADGITFLSMEYVAGETLKQLLEKRTFSIREVCEIGAQVSDALEEAHQQQVIHRDIKPANVMLDARERVKVLDFGIAKAVLPDADSNGGDATATLETGLGVVLGTAAYMSPEQACAQRIDHRSDLFSLGALLYELTCGKAPFSGRSFLETLSRVAAAEPARVSTLRSDCPPELERIIYRCLHKNPDARYQTARDVFVDLQRLATRSTGERRRVAPQLTRAAIGLVLVSATVIAGLWMLRNRSERQASAPAPAVAIASVAVLPFANLSASADAEFMADGLTEEIINALAQLPDLRVVSRTSAFAFKEKDADIRDIGRRLDVQSVVEGAVRRSGNVLRVTAQLTSTEDGYHVWSNTYEREVRDVFAIQDEIAAAVARALQARLTPGQRLGTRPTQSVEAYEQYLRGRHFSNIWTRESLDRAVGHYRQAIAADPVFAPAYAGLAETYSLMDHASDAPMRREDEFYDLAIASARKALEIDPGSVEAHAALGHIFMHQGHFADAERHLESAVALNPNSAVAHQWYGILLRHTGRHREADNEMAKTRTLDPLSATANHLLINGLINSGDFAGAVEAGRRGLEIAPDHAEMRFLAALAYALAGDGTDALQLLLEASANPRSAANTREETALILAIAGRRTEALSLLQSADSGRRPNRVIAMAYAALGENDAAIQRFQRLARERPNYARLNVILPPHPAFAGLRADPRYRSLRRELGLPEL